MLQLAGPVLEPALAGVLAEASCPHLYLQTSSGLGTLLTLVVLVQSKGGGTVSLGYQVNSKMSWKAYGAKGWREGHGP